MHQQIRWTKGVQTSVVEKNDFIGKALCLCHRVRDQKDRASGPVPVGSDSLLGQKSGFHIHGGGGFIQQKELIVPHQKPA